jgi:hypothetical protein
MNDLLTAEHAENTENYFVQQGTDENSKRKIPGDNFFICK